MRSAALLLTVMLGTTLAAASPACALEDLRPRSKPTASAWWDPLGGPFDVRRDPLADSASLGPVTGVVGALRGARSIERAPQPGDWTATIDPDFDLSPREATPESERNRLSELLTPLRLQTLRVEVTRHF